MKTSIFALAFLLIASTASQSAIPLVNKSVSFDPNFESPYGDYNAQYTVARTTNSHFTIERLIHFVQTFSSSSTVLNYQVYVSSNSSYDQGDLLIHEYQDTGHKEWNPSTSRTETRYDIPAQRIALNWNTFKSRISNNQFYLIVRGRHGVNGRGVTWGTPKVVNVRKISLIDRIIYDPHISSVSQLPQAAGSWWYDLRVSVDRNIQRNVPFTWRFRLVEGTGGSTILKSGTTTNGGRIRGRLTIDPGEVFGSPSIDYLYFEILPSYDTNQGNNSVRTIFQN